MALFRSILFTAFFTTALLTLVACDDYPSTNPQSGCGANTAMIGVRDGYAETLCGCAEGSGKTTSQGQTLKCTIPKGTWMVFDFSSTQLVHQIIPTGTPTFQASSVKDPSNSDTNSPHSIQFTASGTYSFRDQYEASLVGQIIVQ